MITYYIHRFQPHKGDRIIQGIYPGLGMRWGRLGKVKLERHLGILPRTPPLTLRFKITKSYWGGLKWFWSRSNWQARMHRDSKVLPQIEEVGNGDLVSHEGLKSPGRDVLGPVVSWGCTEIYLGKMAKKSIVERVERWAGPSCWRVICVLNVNGSHW